ncbi:MAG: hypothetical protein LBP94_03550 [Zoogloeaceae bacterium]|jgi:hypothetical protein|nr:hypothetical protein [Zoogloeaceae bacterium]
MQARRLPARHGLLWLIASFRIFRRNPPLITGLAMAYLFVVIAVNLVPVVGPFLMPLALPMLVVILANGCRVVQRGGGIGAVALTYGIQQRRVELIRLGGLHLLGSLLILLISSIIADSPAALPESDEARLKILAQVLIIALPVIAAFWFAPLLTAWDEIAPMKAVFFSFMASVRNWRAFAVYALVTGLIGVLAPSLLLIAANAISDVAFDLLALLLRLILLFVIAPVIMTSVFVSYQDVFHGKADGD